MTELLLLLRSFFLVIAASAFLTIPFNAHAVGAQGPVAQGDLPGPGTSGVHAVRTPQDWQKFQRERGLNWPIAIDFTRDMVIAVFLGTRNSAGYKIEIAEIRAEPHHTEITYREIPPAATNPVAQMLTNPYVLAVIPQPQTPVMFSKGFFSTMEVPYGEFTRLVRYMSETDYQLVLLDIMMPGASGLEVLGRRYLARA